MQSTNKVLMVRPVKFGYNEQTAENNSFQVKGDQELALKESINEFDQFVKLLQDNGVNVIVVQDTEIPHTPDSIFPNNWFSTHEEGDLVLYPMCAPNRRLERKEGVMDAIRANFKIANLIDLTGWEQKDKFLEGTGSMVLDRENMIAYACISARTDEAVLEEFCDKTGYDFVAFGAYDQNDNPIYHTNVMMSVGSEFAVVCLDAITDLEERVQLIEMIEETDKEIIEISLEQMGSFAGNMLELRDKDDEPILVMSKTAYNSLENEQIQILSTYCKIITPDINNIEINGGGSARCMIAEIF